MNMWQTLLIVLGVIAAVAIALQVLLPALKKCGVDITAALEYMKEAVSAVDKTLDTIRPFLPASPGLVIFDKILAAATVGVGKAEQLYHIGGLNGNKRKQEAKANILEVLKLGGVEITPAVKKLIDGAIEAEVLNLGHQGNLAKSGLALVPADAIKPQAALASANGSPAPQ